MVKLGGADTVGLMWVPAKVALVLALGVAVILSGVDVANGAQKNSGSNVAPSRAFYLALGGSQARGIQPTARYPKGAYSGHGYTVDVVAAAAMRGVDLRLTDLGCPEETVVTMITGHDRCHRVGRSQLESAVAFLMRHRGEKGVVSIDLGFNDVLPCLYKTSGILRCTTRLLGQIRAKLALIERRLVTAGGKDVVFIGLTHYDPMIIYALRRATSERARESLASVVALNRTLEASYKAAGLRVANIAGVFDHKAGRGRGELLSSARRTCAWTWMCARSPYGPNIHPRTKGYDVEAGVIERVLFVSKRHRRGATIDFRHSG